MAHSKIEKERVMKIALKSAAAVGALLVLMAPVGAARSATLKTGYFSIAHMAMVPAIVSPTTASETFWGVGLKNSATETACFHAAVNLPQGAVIKGVSVTYSSGPATNPTASLIRHRFSMPDTETIAYRTLINSSGQRRSMPLILNPAYTRVDNARFSYGLGICLGGSGGDTFHSARIVYSYLD